MFPHSEIRGSWDICSSPRLFAAYHVFHRLLVPRHPPCALIGLTFLCRPMVLVASFSNKYKSLHSRLLLKITFLGCLVIKHFLFNRILILYAVFKVQCAVQKSIIMDCNGDGEIRTLDPLLARQVLSQLSYIPAYSFFILAPACSPMPSPA